MIASWIWLRTVGDTSSTTAVMGSPPIPISDVAIKASQALITSSRVLLK